MKATLNDINVQSIATSVSQSMLHGGHHRTVEPFKVSCKFFCTLSHTCFREENQKQDYG